MPSEERGETRRADVTLVRKINKLLRGASGDVRRELGLIAASLTDRDNRPMTNHFCCFMADWQAEWFLYCFGQPGAPVRATKGPICGDVRGDQAT